MEAQKEPWELIYVDDGSDDTSVEKILAAKKSRPFIRLITLTKNFGQTSAFDVGFRAATGEIVVCLDGDGQNDPKDIPLLLETLKSADMVCGWRKNRKDPLISKKIPSRIVFFVRSRLLRDCVHDSGCSLKAFKREAFNKIKLFTGLHRFLPALFVNEGFTVKEVVVNHRHRTQGVSKYGFNRLSSIFDILAVYWMKKRSLKHAIKKEL